MGRRSQDNQIDWELIEKAFRLGQSTLRQLAAEFKVQASAISRKAKRDGWVQDKRQEIKARSENQLLLSNTRKATEKATPTPEDIEVAATARTNVVLAHRADIKRSRGITMALLSELELQAGPENAALLEELGTLMHKPDDKGVDKLNELYQKIISLPGRAKTMKDLGESLRIMVALERQAFGVDDVADDDSAQKTLLEAMLGARARIR